MKRFRTPELALHSFEGHSHVPVQPPILHYRDSSTQTHTISSDVLEQTKTLLATLPKEEQVATVGKLMQYIAQPDVLVSPDFIEHALVGMKNLTVAGRSNILAGLAKALGTKKADGSSRMCLSQMPVGLLEYAASFFSSDSFYEVYFLEIMFLMCIYTVCIYRSSVAHRTTSFGASPCTASLERSGQRSMVVPCGQSKL